jgi:hypothetical protein
VRAETRRLFDAETAADKARIPQIILKYLADPLIIYSMIIKFKFPAGRQRFTMIMQKVSVDRLSHGRIVE